MKMKKNEKNTGRTQLTALMLVAVMAIVIPSHVVAETYDVVINNGRIMDPETNFDGVRNVGIRRCMTTYVKTIPAGQF